MTKDLRWVGYNRVNLFSIEEKIKESITCGCMPQSYGPYAVSEKTRSYYYLSLYLGKIRAHKRLLSESMLVK